MNPVALSSALDLSGKVAVVTGASRGIGRGIASRLAEAGARVIVNYRQNEPAAWSLAEELRGDAVQADVTNREDVQRMFDDLERIDIVVNNAGIYPLSPLLEMKDEEWDAVVDANLKGVHLCTQVAARRMTDGGSIVNIASIEALAPAPAHAHYNAAKGGVLMHTRAAALELGPKNIRVNAVSPGLIFYDELPELWPDGVKRYKEAAPLGRLGRAHEVADAVLFLVSPLAAFVTGANLVVDGGVLSTPAF